MGVGMERIGWEYGECEENVGMRVIGVGMRGIGVGNAVKRI